MPSAAAAAAAGQINGTLPQRTKKKPTAPFISKLKDKFNSN